jgi:myo-inositol-1(or 4)-monophosphatase
MDAAAIADRYDFAATLIADAGALSLGYFRDQGSLEIASKGLQDMASQADLETERLIRGRIAESYPDDAFFGEETGGIAPAPGQGVWVVDPIDGTANFVSAIPMWCVSIAFVIDRVIEFGLVLDPNHDELFAARRGHGATLNGQAIRPDGTTSLADGRFAISFSHPSKPHQASSVIHALLECGGLHEGPVGGALGLAYVACGRTIGYYEPHINSWDCYGAVAVLREAGAWVCDAEAGDGLIAGCEIIATAPGVKQPFLDLLAGVKAAQAE